ncbi:F-box domain containing protein [Tanacetum coccineum]
MKENTPNPRISKCNKMKDRFTLLPDFIVRHILSYLLDDPKSRVRMIVKYDEEYVKEKFYKYVEHTVSRFCEQNISAHTLNIAAEITNLEQGELFGRCLDLVLEKGLQMMDIQFDYYPVKLPLLCLPNTLLSASSLTSLTLHRCELPPSLMVGVVKFKSLRLLSLSNLPIDDGAIEYLTKGCPVLEEIYLRYCYGFKTFCVKRHQNLLKVEIYCNCTFLPERIDVEAPNLSYFLLESSKYKDKAPSMLLGSCKNLTTFCYCGFPFKRFNDFLSSFPLLENVALDLPPRVNNLKLSNNSLRKIRLQSHCNLDETDLNAPNLLSFEYCNEINFHNFAPLSREDSSLTRGCMKCDTTKYFDILWFQKLRRFLDKNGIFNVLKLVIHKEPKDVEKLKVIQQPPHELEHVEFIHTLRIHEVSVYATVLDAVLWCCRPRSLTLQVDQFSDTSDVVKLSKKHDNGACKL